MTEKHEAFARAVVALAREHKMNHIALSFRLNSDNSRECGPWSNPTTTITWNEGRNGDRNDIQMRSETYRSLREEGDK